MKKIVLLGATGSIGDSTLNILRHNKDFFELTGFSFHSNQNKADHIAAEFPQSKIFCSKVTNETKLSSSYGSIHEFITSIECDIVVNGIVGAAGTIATLTAIALGKTILLANKESLVMAGSLIQDALKNNPRAQLLPIDSEHNSVFRLLQNNQQAVASITITASGGPFFGKEVDLQQVSVAEVTKHPVWNMGAKISVDSASLINKALEIIEAHYLFQLPYDQLRAVIHPQSFVHAILDFKDGSRIMHASQPDMQIPIAHALFFPVEANNNLIYSPLPQQLNFFDIDKNKFPGFYLGIEAARQGGCWPAIFNAANEAAVELFLQNKISFAQIIPVIEKVLNANRYISAKPDWQLIQAADLWARKQVDFLYAA